MCCCINGLHSSKQKKKKLAKISDPWISCSMLRVCSFFFTQTFSNLKMKNHGRSRRRSSRRDSMHSLLNQIGKKGKNTVKAKRTSFSACKLNQIEINQISITAEPSSIPSRSLTPLGPFRQPSSILSHTRFTNLHSFHLVRSRCNRKKSQWQANFNFFFLLSLP